MLTKISSALKGLWEHIVGLVKRLVSLHDPPHSIAGGAAIGICLGFTPLFGLKTVLVLVIAWMFRCSPISAVIAVTLHDVLLPLTPIILKIEYEIGFYVIHHHFPPKFILRHAKLADMFQWTTFFNVGWPLLLGSLVIGIPTAIISYFIMLEFIKKYRRHKAAKLQDIDPSA